MKKAFIRRQRGKDLQGEEFLSTICSNLSFTGEGAKKIMITSWGDGDGKTFMAQRIGRDMGLRGMRVVIVSANLREEEPADKKKGLMQYLSGQCGVEDIVYETGTENAFEVPAGGKTEQAIPYLNRGEFSALLDTLAEKYDRVLIDTPAIGQVIDAAEIAKHCDGALLVAKYNDTTAADLKKAKKQLNLAGCPILGCVINQVSDAGIEGRRLLQGIGL